MARPAFCLANGRPILPDPRHAGMSTEDLADAVVTLVAALHNFHLQACLASQRGRGELQQWAAELEEELAVEVDRIVVELEGRTGLTAVEQEQRDFAVAVAAPKLHVLNQLGVAVDVVRTGRRAA